MVWIKPNTRVVNFVIGICVHSKNTEMYTLRRTQFIPVSLDKAWEFFSSPANLNEITPDDMQFFILGNVPEKMYPGLFINYKVSPFKGIRMNWTTEITHVRDQEFFVDEQRIGPYKVWHHEHHFKKVNGGVEMTDIVSYLPPYGILGRLVHPLIIAPKLNKIFSFRNERIERIFGTLKKQDA